LGLISFYTVAKLFSELPSSPHNKVFIYTGNACISLVIPTFMSLGVVKNAAAYVIESAAASYGKEGNGEKGFWYFGDERKASGQCISGAPVSGEGHADFYWELANKREQGPWNATFVTGDGYVDFDSQRDRPSKTVAQLQE
jgi:hypothetical protein